MAQTDEFGTETSLVDEVLDAPSPNSTMEKLRAARREADNAAIYELEVPAYRGLLAIRFGKVITYADIDKIMTKAQRSKKPEDALNAQIDILVKCTVGFAIRGDIDEDFVVLEDDQGPVLWGRQLIDYLGLPFAPNTRAIVKEIFGNDIAIVSAQKLVFEWIQGGLTDGSGREVSGE